MRLVHRIVLVLATIVLTACGTIDSGLSIPPGEEFRLGENRHGRFSVSVENRGDVPVTLFAEAADGGRTELATLAPGAEVEQSFPADTVGIFVNATERSAELAVTIRGDTDLSMGYEPI